MLLQNIFPIPEDLPGTPKELFNEFHQNRSQEFIKFLLVILTGIYAGVPPDIYASFFSSVSFEISFETSCWRPSKKYKGVILGLLQEFLPETLSKFLQVLLQDILKRFSPELLDFFKLFRFDQDFFTKFYQG